MITDHLLEEVSDSQSNSETPNIVGQTYAISITNEVLNEVKLHTCPHCKRLLERALARMEKEEADKKD